MRHLTLEALARLVDEAPDPAEASHLAECDECSRELEALHEQGRALASLPRMVPPPDAWDALRHRLRDEGLVETPRRRVPVASLRAAAAAGLFLLGGAAGWAARGPLLGPRPTTTAAAEPATPEAPGRTLAEADPRGTVPAGGLGSTATPAAGDDVDRAEEEFLAALDRFMMTTGTDASDPAARLAALDNIVLTTAEALNEAPADPVLNTYHLIAQAQRRAVLRQIEATAGEPVF